jgi:hypothetical protein
MGQISREVGDVEHAVTSRCSNINPAEAVWSVPRGSVGVVCVVCRVTAHQSCAVEAKTRSTCVRVLHNLCFCGMDGAGIMQGF